MSLENRNPTDQKQSLNRASVRCRFVDDLARDPEVSAYIAAANANLGVLGFTEHGTRHANLVARIARNVLRRLEYDQHLQELAAIAGYFTTSATSSAATTMGRLVRYLHGRSWSATRSPTRMSR